jgi:hypothetical protein
MYATSWERLETQEERESEGKIREGWRSARWPSFLPKADGRWWAVSSGVELAEFENFFSARTTEAGQVFFRG